MGAAPWISDISKKEKSPKKSPLGILRSWKEKNVPIEILVSPVTGKVTLSGGTNEAFSIWDYSLATIRGGKIVLVSALRKPEELRYLEVSLKSEEGTLFTPPSK